MATAAFGACYAANVKPGRGHRSTLKRVYRVMRDHNLLLERRIKQPGVQRRHEGRIAVQTSDTRWCSDGFEFRCDDGAKLSVTFALDCCDREAIGWVASPTGYSGDDIRDLMLESVEKRFWRSTAKHTGAVAER